MRAATRRIVFAVTILALASAVWAGVPWKGGNGAGADAPAATLDEVKADLGQARYDRVVAPIQSKMTLADKAMEPYQKEMEKPVGKRRTELLQKCKVRSAQMHEAAAKAAKRAQLMLQKASHRACIEEEFEKPNRDAAVRTYLELSRDARLEGNIPQAAVFCKKALGVDSQNAEARQLFKQLAEEYRQAVRDRQRQPGGTGGGSEDKKSWEWDRDSDHNRDWGDWRNYGGGGRRGWY